MPRFRPSPKPLQLLVDSSRHQQICPACRVQQTLRQLHTTRPLAAQIPFFKRARDALFGSKTQTEEEQARRKLQLQRLEEQGGEGKVTEVTSTTRLGQERLQVAALVDPSVTRDYILAQTWEGLERIGGEKWVKRARDQGELYRGFLPQKKVQLDDAQWRKILHHVTIEVLALEAARRDFNELCRPTTHNPVSTDGVKIELGNVEGKGKGKGYAFAGFGSGETKKELLKDISAKLGDASEDSGAAWNMAETRAVILESRLDQYGEGTHPWMALSLQDSRLKFAILKRTMQLTGHRISDHVVSSVGTLADLYHAFRAREPPKKLAQTPQLQQLGRIAPNVAVHARRQTPIHKEKAVGRWKVIEEALLARGLPVTGTHSRHTKLSPV